MGQLFPLLQELGATKVTSIEPSEISVKVSQELYPNTPIFFGSLFNMPEERQFESATMVMVFEHIIDTDSAFKKIRDQPAAWTERALPCSIDTNLIPVVAYLTAG